MEAVSSLVKVSLPNYLRNLPIPSSLSGFAQLTGILFLFSGSPINYHTIFLRLKSSGTMSFTSDIDLHLDLDLV